jgi:hypothetical protein
VELYPDAGEEIPKDLPAEKGLRVRMTVYVNADHARDLVTRRSIAGILFMLNNTLLDGFECIKWHESKCVSNSLNDGDC